MTNEASEREALTDGEIDSLWLTRPSIHGGDLTLQLRDFARAVESAVRAAAPAVQAPPDGWKLVPVEPTQEWIEAIEPIDVYHGVAADNIRVMLKKAPLYAAAPTAAQPNTDGVEMVAPAGGLDPGPPRCSDPGPPPPIYGVSACELCVKGFPVENGQHYGTQALGMIQATPCTAGVTTCGGPEGGCLAICDQHAACKLRAAGAPASSAPFDKVRAHCLIYDLFINDDQLIRSMAAQDLKRLLGITGPVPANHSGVAPVEAPRCPHGIRHPHPCRECEDAPLPAGVQPSDGGQEK
jgi:hypothetical protein